MHIANIEIQLRDPNSGTITINDGSQFDTIFAATWCRGGISCAVSARRLVACWNACRGIDTKALEDATKANQLQEVEEWKQKAKTIAGGIQVRCPVMTPKGVGQVLTQQEHGVWWVKLIGGIEHTFPEADLQLLAPVQ